MIHRAGAAFVVFALLAAAAATGYAAEPAAPAAPTPAPGKDAAAQAKDATAEQLIQQIQKDNEAVITGRRFTYDPAGRRDPFEPLIKTDSGRPDSKRPKGVAGMLISEIDLRGVATDTLGSPVALFRGSDNRPYPLRVGDIVYDGRVISIDPRRGQVVFRQQVDDPRRIKPYRDVIKRLQVTGGEEGDAPAEEEGA